MTSKKLDSKIELPAHFYDEVVGKDNNIQQLSSLKKLEDHS